MPLKGGIKQRIARAQKATTVSTEKCDDIVRRNFKKGKWSAPDVVELSDAVASIVPNACPSSSIAKLAKCGKGGSIRGNCSRDVVRAMTDHTKPPLYSADVVFLGSA